MASVMASFPRFGELPPELRQMIWEFAMPADRLWTVELSLPVPSPKFTRLGVSNQQLHDVGSSCSEARYDLEHRVGRLSESLVGSTEPLWGHEESSMFVFVGSLASFSLENQTIEDVDRALRIRNTPDTSLLEGLFLYMDPGRQPPVLRNVPNLRHVVMVYFRQYELYYLCWWASWAAKKHETMTIMDCRELGSPLPRLDETTAARLMSLRYREEVPDDNLPQDLKDTRDLLKQNPYETHRMSPPRIHFVTFEGKLIQEKQKKV